MDDPNFKESIVLITEHNENGAMGFVINQLLERPSNALVEFSNSPAFPLHSGGPVDKEHLFFIHQRPDIIPDGTKIIDNLYFGGDFKKAIVLIDNKALTSADIKLFIGYCGWDNQELEEEVNEGSWKITDINWDVVFAESPLL